MTGPSCRDLLSTRHHIPNSPISTSLTQWDNPWGGSAAIGHYAVERLTGEDLRKPGPCCEPAEAPHILRMGRPRADALPKAVGESEMNISPAVRMPTGKKSGYTLGTIYFVELFTKHV
jgi:hypothetical protein